MGANFLEVLCPAESLLSFIEVKRRARLFWLLPICPKCCLAVMCLYYTEALNRISFLFINFAL